MLKWLTKTQNDPVATLLRLALAIAIFPHGAQKVLGWFGGYGFQGTLTGFTQTLGIPAALALLVFAAEFLGPLGLAVGLFSRVAAFGIAAVMVGAVLLVHLPNGFFLNWAGSQAGEGFEYHLLAIALSIAVMIKGSGAWSLDQLIASARPAERRERVLSAA